MYKVKLNVTSGHATQDKPVLRPLSAAVPALSSAIAPVGLGLSLNLSNSLKQLNDPVSDAPALPTTIPLNTRDNIQPGAFAHLDNERVAAVVATEPETAPAAASVAAAPSQSADDAKAEEMDGVDTMEDLASSMVIKSTAKTGISASLATATDADEAALPAGLSSAIKKVHASLPSHPRSTAKKQAKKLKSAANAAAAAVTAEEAGGAPFETVVSGKNKKKNKKKPASAAGSAPAAASEAKGDASSQAAPAPAAGAAGGNDARVAKKKRDKKRLKKKAAAAAAAAGASAAPVPPATASPAAPSAPSTAAPAPAPAPAKTATVESPSSPPESAPLVARAVSSESVDDSAPESPYVKSNDAFNSYRAKKLAPGNLNQLAERLSHLPKVASAVKKGSAAGKSRPRLDDAFHQPETIHDGSDESKHNGDSSSAAQPSASGTENESPGSARGHGSRRHRSRKDKKTQELHIHQSHPPAVDPAVAQQLLEKQQAAAAASLAKSAEARARLRTMLSHASRSGGSVAGSAPSAVPSVANVKAARSGIAAGGTSLASLSGISSHGTTVKTAPALAVRGLQSSEGPSSYQFPASSFQDFLKLNNEFVVREVLRHLRLDASADGVLSAVLDHTLAIDSNQ